MKGRWYISASIILLVALFLALVYIAGRYHGNNPFHKSPAPVTGSVAHPPAVQASALAHVFIIVEENKPISDVMGNSQAPYINALAKQYAVASNYYGVAHPSLPNYLALTSGSTDGVTSDCNPPGAGCEVSVPSIADELEHAGRTWKAYAEGMPANCYITNAGEYVTKHNPFVYYTDIVNNSARCKAHVVPFSQLTTDLTATKTTPNFAFITPNLCNDMHDCSVSTGNNWLAQYVPRILHSPAFTTQNSLLVITWDEGDSGSNHIPTILVGTNIKHGYQAATYYDHYALLHTIEAAWGLPTLTVQDKQAPLMNEFFVNNKL